MGQQVAVTIDMSPNRCNTRGIASVLLAIAFRVLLGGLAVAALAIGLDSHARGSVATVLVIASVVLAVGASLNFAIAAVTDYQSKQHLGSKYGLDIRYGVDSFQRRSIRVVGPVDNLNEAIVDSLRRLSREGAIREPAANRFECKLPRRGSGPPSTVYVEVDSEGDERIVRVESASSWSGMIFRRPIRMDCGQSITNVEEFQVEFKRRLESVKKESGRCEIRS